MNALHPSHMSAAERLDEIAEILATGLMRLRARQSSPLSGSIGESSLDCAAHQSGHPGPLGCVSAVSPSGPARTEDLPNHAVIRLARALAKDAARQDHERQCDANETSGDLRPVLDRPPRR